MSPSASQELFLSNCEHIKLFARRTGVESALRLPIAELDPVCTEFEYLKYSPFVIGFDKLDLRKFQPEWEDCVSKATSEESSLPEKCFPAPVWFTTSIS